eukprot:4161567-Lingulodinium_polyedra.AAC.1
MHIDVTRELPLAAIAEVLSHQLDRGGGRGSSTLGFSNPRNRCSANALVEEPNLRRVCGMSD